MTHYHTYTGWADCPSCDGQIKVEARIYPGEEPTYYPNHHAHPGCPPDVEIVRELERECCKCDVDFDELNEHNRDRLLRDAGEKAREREMVAAERKAEERMERRMMEGWL